MQKTQWLMLFHMSVLCAGLAHADSFSLTGTLATPESVQYFILNLPSAESLTLQTYGFGGGTNAAGTQISPVGTDPFLAVFAGTGPGAAILTDGAPRPGPNPFGTSLDLTNYSNFQGCPSANAPTIGGMPQCGDARMTFSSLAASTYTIALSDGQYQANAVFDNGTLGEGFVDFTGGAAGSPQFCNIAINGVNCPANSPTIGNPEGNGTWALDIITGGSASVTVVPEPGTLVLAGVGLLSLAGLRKRRGA